MEHFVAYERGGGPGTSLESSGRMKVSSRGHGHLLDALNDKVWLVRATKTRAGAKLELLGVCIAAAICEDASGEFVFEGVDAIDFEPPVVLSECNWFESVSLSWSRLRTGLVRITEGIDHLLEIEHRERTARGRHRPRQGSAGGTRDVVHEGASGGEVSRAHREKAVAQQHAMSCALDYYRLRWKNVEDVSSREPYELRCDDPKGRTLEVSVKGTTGSWEHLLLTAAEVRHARESYPDVAFFILHDIGVVVGTDRELVGRGGTMRVIDPWDITLDELSPLIFGCRLARTRATKHGSR